MMESTRSSAERAATVLVPMFPVAPVTTIRMQGSYPWVGRD
jgi:hypothetical protein